MIATVADDQGQYLYGIIAATVECGPLPEVRTLRAGGVQALISDVVITDWAADKLTNPDLVAERVLRHQTVLDAVARVTTTVPMRFGTIVRGEAEVRRWMRCSQKTLQLALLALEGRQEWGLKLHCDPVPQVELADSETTSAGTLYLLRRQRQREAERKAAREQARLADWVRALFAPMAEATAMLPLRDGCAVNDALLVRSAALPALFAQEEEVNGQLEGRARVELNGPWPAYTFAPALVSGTGLPPIHG